MSGKSRTPIAIAVAREIDGGGDDLYCGIGTDSVGPDVSLIADSFTPFQAARASVAHTGDPVLVDMDMTAGDFYQPAAEPDTLDDDGGDPIEYRMGDGTISLLPHSMPTADGTWPDHHRLAFGKLLGSGCQIRDAIVTRFLTATGSGSSVDFTVAAVPADVLVGQVLTRSVGERVYGSMVVQKQAGQLDMLMPLGAAIAENDIVRCAQTYEFGKGESLGPSVAVRHDFAGSREYALGGRWTELTFTMNKRVVQCDLAMSYDLIVDASDDAAVVAGTNTDTIPYEPPGRRVYTWAGTRPQLSTAPSFDRTDNTLVAPVTLAGVVLDVDEITVKVTNTLGRQGSWDGLGPGPRKVASTDVEITLLLSSLPAGHNALRSSLWQAWKNYRALSLPIGPTGQHGGCWIAPGAVLKTDIRKLDAGKELFRVPLTFGVGPNITELSGGTAPLKLGLV